MNARLWSSCYILQGAVLMKIMVIQESIQYAVSTNGAEANGSVHKVASSRRHCHQGSIYMLTCREI
jgi:hypothetical protein